MPQLASLGHTAELDLTLTMVDQKDTIILVISSYFKALYERGNLRLKAAPKKRIHTSPPPPPSSQNISKADFRMIKTKLILQRD